MRITEINGQTRLIGFFGSTYQTSKMYAMYNAAIQALGLNYVYVPFAVNDLEQAVAGIRHLGVAAIGITIPYKVEIMPYLDELDSDAQRIGAVNVVVNRDGRLIGSNTDGRGALRALQEQSEVQQRQITLLGAGGAARAIAFALRDAGATVTIINRTAQYAHDLAAAVGGDTTGGGIEQLAHAVSRSDIIINTTPVGMANTPQEGLSLVPAHLLRPDMTVMDIVSNPRETRLLQDAQQAGCRVVYGYRMLLWQGIDKFRLYTGVEPPIEVMQQAMEQAK
jgi:shikimate dehydrogenase